MEPNAPDPQAVYTFANAVGVVVSPHDLWLRFSVEQPSLDPESVSETIEVARIVLPVRMLGPLIQTLQGLVGPQKDLSDEG